SAARITSVFLRGGPYGAPPALPSFPTRRSSDLPRGLVGEGDGHDVPAAGGLAAHHPIQPGGHVGAGHDGGAQGPQVLVGGGPGGDRKSTRLNSSHVSSSYAVFCLKKKRTGRAND